MPQALREQFVKDRAGLFDSWMKSGRDWGETVVRISRAKDRG
jgi:hypothetical protein